MKKALIVAAGSTDKIQIKKEDYSLVIGADGGYDRAKEMKIEPDIYIGDKDSVKNEINSPIIITLPVEKDLTDTEAAIEEAIKRGFREIDIIGALGTRFDHSLANTLLLFKYHKKGININIVDSNNLIRVISDIFFIEGKKGMTASIIPIDHCLKGIKLKGFYYPLENEDVKIGDTLTISNVIISDKAEIRINEGVALLIIAKD